MLKRILIGLAGIAVVVLAGVLFGLWLSWNAPVDRVAEEPPLQVQAAPGLPTVAGADGQVEIPEPPQPRSDGTRGIPTRPVLPAPSVPTVSAAGEPQPGAMVSTAPLPDAAATPVPGQFVPSVQGSPTAPLPTRIVEQSPPQVATVVAPSAQGQEAWAQALRAELARCSSQSMVSRVMCSEQARWKYCNPDNRWGRIPECPQTGNN